MSEPSPQVAVRPMTPEVADAAARVMEISSDQADLEDNRTPEPVSPERRAAFYRRVARFSVSDPQGCFVAEDDAGQVVGMAASIRRGSFWGLSLLFVHPDRQSSGIGRLLLTHALRNAADARTAMIMSSPDPRAIRPYALTGFDLHPGMWFDGEIDRAGLPATTATTIEEHDDLDLVDHVDARLRGSSRRPDVEYLLGDDGRMFVARQGRERGFALTRNDDLVMLGADTPDAARDLLWHVLAEVSTDSNVEFYGLTAAQQWAFPQLFAVRLRARPGGPLFVRSPDPPPRPWIPSGWYF